MTAIFEFQLPSEILTQDEIAEITGCQRKAEKIDWLTSNGWVVFRSRAGEPIVGRMYARLKLAGINPVALATSGGWVPDWSRMKRGAE